MRRCRALFLILALLSFSLNAGGQTLPVASGAGSGSAEMELLRWAVTQGGLVLVVLVVIWSYRRDFQRLFAAERDRTQELMGALQQASVSLTTHADMMREQTQAAREQAKAFTELSGSVRTCEAVREVFARRAIE